MQIYEAKNYREFLRFRLGMEGETRRRGVITELAEFVKCHQTYVSQVLRDKADFSNEQGLRCCKYLGLGEDETELFINLLNLARASDKATREHFQKRIHRQKQDRFNMKKRWKVTNQLTLDQQALYYESWLPQALHMLAQIGEGPTESEAAQYLGASPMAIARIAQNLSDMGLVARKNNRIVSVQNSIHLGSDSPSIVRSHVNWRSKAAFDLTEIGAGTGTHYSSLVTMAAGDAEKVKALIYDHLEKTRDIIIESPSEEIYCYLLDFYPISRK